jgi:hypothetical protein
MSPENWLAKVHELGSGKLERSINIPPRYQIRASVLLKQREKCLAPPRSPRPHGNISMFPQSTLLVQKAENERLRR